MCSNQKQRPNAERKDRALGERSFWAHQTRPTPPQESARDDGHVQKCPTPPGICQRKWHRTPTKPWEVDLPNKESVQQGAGIMTRGAWERNERRHAHASVAPVLCRQGSVCRLHQQHDLDDKGALQLGVCGLVQQDGPKKERRSLFACILRPCERNWKGPVFFGVTSWETWVRPCFPFAARSLLECQKVVCSLRNLDSRECYLLSLYKCTTCQLAKISLLAR